MRTGTLLILLLALLFVAGCRPSGVEPASSAAHSPGAPATSRSAAAGGGDSTAAAAAPATSTRPGPPPSPTPLPTATLSPTPPATATPLPSPSPTPLAACNERYPEDGELLTLVSRDYGLSRSYAPGDLVQLSDTFANRITLGYPTEVRQVIVGPLQEMLGAMEAAELRPLVVSGFRDYSTQAMAEQKWVEQYPEWAHNLSAPPGHSEHQLGTTVDFSSPDLPEMVGIEHIQFHPAFAQSKEGMWLAGHAHEYGFTMSYPADRFEDTAFYYEPWHYRYVGVELATQLYEEGSTISEYLFEQYGPPCIP